MRIHKGMYIAIAALAGTLLALLCMQIRHSSLAPVSARYRLIKVTRDELNFGEARAWGTDEDEEAYLVGVNYSDTRQEWLEILYERRENICMLHAPQDQIGFSRQIQADSPQAALGLYLAGRTQAVPDNLHQGATAQH